MTASANSVAVGEAVLAATAASSKAKAAGPSAQGLSNSVRSPAVPELFERLALDAVVEIAKSRVWESSEQNTANS
eukprot:s100_g28.t1